MVLLLVFEFFNGFPECLYLFLLLQGVERQFLYLLQQGVLHSVQVVALAYNFAFRRHVGKVSVFADELLQLVERQELVVVAEHIVRPGFNVLDEDFGGDNPPIHRKGVVSGGVGGVDADLARQGDAFGLKPDFAGARKQYRLRLLRNRFGGFDGEHFVVGV